jgi:host factor-I protein
MAQFNVVYSAHFEPNGARATLPSARSRVDEEAKMDGETRSLQNDFFNAARKERALVTVFLANGKKLTGRIRSFDRFTLLLETSQGDQMIFKHAISTVSGPMRAGQRSDEDHAHRRVETTPGA